VALFLLLQALFQGLHQLVPAAQRLDLLFLFLGQGAFRQLAQPFFGDFGNVDLFGLLKALEDMAEHLVELVQVLFVLHQGGAGQVIEILDAVARQARIHAFQQGQVFAQGDRQLGRTQFEKEVDEHGPEISADPPPMPINDLLAACQTGRRP
jgi:hypothetical protein